MVNQDLNKQMIEITIDKDAINAWLKVLELEPEFNFTIKKRIQNE